MLAGRLNQWLRKRENIFAVIIALVILIVHLSIIDRVEVLIYDEQYYIGEANLIRLIDGEEINPIYFDVAMQMGYDSLEEYKDEGYVQQGPLSKLFFVAGIEMFGDGPWGWRLFPVLFGFAAIIIFYLICQELTSKKWLPVIATFVFAFENMCFIISGIAMLDVIAFTLMLMAFLTYLRGNYIWAGIILALGALAKTGVALGGGVILFHWLLTRRTSNWEGVRFLVAAPLAYAIVLPLLDYIALREFLYPWDHMYDLFSHAGGGASWSTLSIDYLRMHDAIHPWEWIVIPGLLIAYPDPTYEITANWTIWGLIIPSTSYMLYQSVTGRDRLFCLFALMWFVWLYLPWFIIDLGFDKVSYAYHYYHVVGAVCLAAGYMMWKLISVGLEQSDRKLKWLVATPPVLWLTAHFSLFWVMAPVG